MLSLHAGALLLQLLGAELCCLTLLCLADGLVLLLRETIAQTADIKLHLVAHPLLLIAELPVLLPPTHQLFFGLLEAVLPVKTKLLLLFAGFFHVLIAALGLIQSVLGSQKLVLSLAQQLPKPLEVTLARLTLLLVWRDEFFKTPALLGFLGRPILNRHQILLVGLDLRAEAIDLLADALGLLFCLTHLTAHTLQLNFGVSELPTELVESILQLFSLHPCQVLSTPPHQRYLIVLFLTVRISTTEPKVHVGSDLTPDQTAERRE
mmetsp:Transcript_6728/g.15530  ORF Transcript_6728/g.15530 Transcript_6728/m.15530 type:complete len:264 (+) Transcript_6728:1256-2047(+)